MEQKTLFERLGGSEVLNQALFKLEESLKTDSTLAPMHKNVDFQKMHEHRMSYLTKLFGGSSEYSGKSVSEAHKSYNINDAQFNLFVFYFKKALADLSVSQQVIDEVALVLAPTKEEVVSQESLYNRMGGEATISKFNEIFTEKLLADAVLGPIYAKADAKKVQGLREKFLTVLFGGKADYNGRTMREAHASHALNDSHFDRFIFVAQECFTEIKLKEEILREVISVLETIRSEIINQPSLFEKIGKFEALEKIVPKFHEKLLANHIMAPYFAHADIQKLNESRKYYFASILGGPRSYTGKSLREGHSSIKLDDQTFNLFLKFLYQAFIESGIKEDLVYEVIEIVNLTRDKVLNRKSIFERLGGKDALSAIVQKFHANLKLDAVLGPIYEKSDSQKVIKGYSHYLTYLFGGLNEHEGQPLKIIHKSFKLTDLHYNIFISVFTQTLESFKVDSETIKEIEMLFEGKRNEILSKQSIWTRLGGEEFIEKALHKFEEKIMNDSTLKAMHQNVDMKKYHESHKDFFAQIFGGYSFYSGKSLVEAHKLLQLKDEHFNLFVNLFKDTLTEMGTKEELVSEIMILLESQRNEVLNKTSLYERLGGEKTIETLVEKLNHQLTSDPVLGPMHQGVNMEKLYLHRKQFFTQFFGGLKVYQGKDIKSAHSDLHLNDDHFNTFLKYFKSALEQTHIKEDLIEETISKIETTRGEILSKHSMISIYERLGGEKAIETLVERLNHQLTSDPVLGPMHQGVNMEKLYLHRKQFFTQFFGGAKAYEGKDIKSAHSDLHLNDEHFNLFVRHFKSVLEEMHIKEDLINETISQVETTRKEILSHPSLYEKLGGKAGIEKFVEKLNGAVAKDSTMTHFFEKVDMQKYSQDQLHFFLSLFGGEIGIGKKTVETIGEPLPLSDEHFKSFVGHAHEALKEMNTDNSVIEEVVKVFEVKRNEVLGQ